MRERDRQTKDVDGDDARLWRLSDAVVRSTQIRAGVELANGTDLE